MTQRKTSSRFIVCLKNNGHPASLEVRKLERTVPDAGAEREGLIRVVDESGEDSLYPADLFEPIAVPTGLGRRLMRAG
ncbi:MAG: hypothetical protein HRU76_11610 [Phycisphaeraceae bacterium]|nr:hypothetical protein [Phycisphaerales bacterium]QOJ18199.1 MAG: hypothetical protein HRU76_11610 [Phycisphaeraceae bacterium]